MAKDKSLIEAITTHHDGSISLRLTGGRTLNLTQRDVELLEIGFHTHCPDCKHRAPEDPREPRE